MHKTQMTLGGTSMSEGEPVALRDGSPAWLRPTRPADVDGLTDLFARASRESLLLRFFTPLRHVDPRLIEQIACSDGDERMAYVVTRESEGAEQILAVGNYCRLPRRDTADVAFFVDDAEQEKGLGTLLLERLALHARSHGIATLIADVMSVNGPMLRVFRDSGLVSEVRAEGDTLRVKLASEAGEAAVDRADARPRLLPK